MAERAAALTPKADRMGPVFISYRRDDGQPFAELVDTLLRAGGVVPWRDVVDLPAGETDARIREAFTEGISGAVLIVTPEITCSKFIPEVELPALMELDEASDNSSVNHAIEPSSAASFRLHVANTLPASGTGTDNEAGCDIEAPDQLLRTGNDALQRRKQYPLVSGEVDVALRELLRDLLLQRLRARERQLGDKQVTIHTQTRPAPNSRTATDLRPRDADPYDLAIRLRQDPASALPQELGYRCFQLALPELIDSLHNHGVQKLTFEGGGHPSLYWALGAALPETRHGYGTVEVSDIRNGAAGHPLLWREAHSADANLDDDRGTHTTRCYLLAACGHLEKCDRNSLRRLLENQRREQSASLDRTLPSVAVLMAGAKEPKGHLLAALAARLPGCLAAVVLRVEARDESDKIFFPADEGFRLAREITDWLTLINRASQGADIHLATTLPSALMLLVARRSNTIPVVLYEPDRDVSGGAEAYRAVLRIEPGRDNPITHVFPQRTPQTVTTLRNLTPHDVSLIDEAGQVAATWERQHPWARVGELIQTDTGLTVDGVSLEVAQVSQHGLVDAPIREDGVGFIVSRVTAMAAGRADFFFPHGEVRDKVGKILGFRRLGAFPLPVDALAHLQATVGFGSEKAGQTEPTGE